MLSSVRVEIQGSSILSISSKSTLPIEARLFLNLPQKSLAMTLFSGVVVLERDFMSQKQKGNMGREDEGTLGILYKGQ